MQKKNNACHGYLMTSSFWQEFV